MKKIFAIYIITVLAVTMFTGCGKTEESGSKPDGTIQENVITENIIYEDIIYEDIIN